MVVQNEIIVVISTDFSFAVVTLRIYINMFSVTCMHMILHESGRHLYIIIKVCMHFTLIGTMACGHAHIQTQSIFNLYTFVRQIP